MEQELAYSFHLGSDKNKSKLAKKGAKGNVSGTTSLSNNAIQNANDLSRANKHNLRDYDNQRELITTIYGTNDIVEDVKQVYIDEFEKARIEFNNKQIRNDRKIKNYFKALPFLIIILLLLYGGRTYSQLKLIRNYNIIGNDKVIVYSNNDYYITLDCNIKDNNLIIYKGKQEKIDNKDVYTISRTFEKVELR